MSVCIFYYSSGIHCDKDFSISILIFEIISNFRHISFARATVYLLLVTNLKYMNHLPPS